MLPKNLVEFCESRTVESFYLYDLQALRQRAEAFRKLFPEYYQIQYAVKANFNHGVIRELRRLDYGADVVSSGEVSRAIESKIPASKIIFSGVGKTISEIESALVKGVSQINVESEAELKRIFEVANSLGLTARVALRVNPNVEADTHPYIRTGLLENKFGIDFDTAAKIMSEAEQYAPAVDIAGLTMHIGSQILDTKPFFEAAEKVANFYLESKKKLPSLRILDFGGGLGIDYEKDAFQEEMATAAAYAAGLVKITDPLIKTKQVESVFLEPGRFIVAHCGYLFSRIQYVKRTPQKNFLIVDTGMHHLMRPSLYKAFHRIESLSQLTGKKSDAFETFDVVGPICESSDVLGPARALPANLSEGDWLVIRDVGAYGAVMASNYNMRPHAPEFLCDGEFL